MNQNDRNRMARLYTCLANIPFPNRGRTVGVADLSEFMKNMDDMQHLLLPTVMAISRVDDPSMDPDSELTDLEDFLRGLGCHIPEYGG